MDVFVHKYQPDRYKLWKAGKDNAAINHSKPTPEAARFLTDNKNQLPKSPAEDGSEVTSCTQEDKRSLLVYTILPLARGCVLTVSGAMFSCKSSVF